MRGQSSETRKLAGDSWSPMSSATANSPGPNAPNSSSFYEGDSSPYARSIVDLVLRPRRARESNRGSAAVNLALRNDLGAVRIDGARDGRGKPLNAIAYGTLTGHLTRTLNALGLKREPIDVTPALHEYLDTLQEPADPPDLVAVASADEGEN